MRTGFVSDDGGATMVEFAIALPVIVLIVLVCLDFGRAVNANLVVGNASREGVRYAATHPSAGPSAIRGFLATRVAPLDPTALAVTVSSARTSDPRWPATDPAPTIVTVSVAYRWSASTWLTSTFFSASAGSPTFQSTATMETMR